MSAIASLMTMPAPGFAHRDLAPWAAVDLFRAEVLLRDLVAPVAERAFGELHDVPLVHERDALALILDRVGDRAVDQAHAAGAADGFDPEADHDVGRFRRADLLPKLRRLLLRAEADLLERLREFLLEEPEDLLRLVAAGGVIDAGVDVLGVLAEDDHVDLLRVLHGRGDALEVLHRSQADEQVEHLPQRDIQRADAAADRRRQRAFDADEILAKRVDRVVRQPVIEFVLRRLPGEDLEPRDLLLPAIGFLDRRIEHALARRPDITPRPVAADERNHRPIRHGELPL